VTGLPDSVGTRYPPLTAWFAPSPANTGFLAPLFLLIN